MPRGKAGLRAKQNMFKSIRPVIRLQKALTSDEVS